MSELSATSFRHVPTAHSKVNHYQLTRIFEADAEVGRLNVTVDEAGKGEMFQKIMSFLGEIKRQKVCKTRKCHRFKRDSSNFGEISKSIGFMICFGKELFQIGIVTLSMVLKANVVS